MFDYLSGLKVFSKKGKNIQMLCITIKVFQFWKLNINSLQSLWIYMQTTQLDIKFFFAHKAVELRFTRELFWKNANIERRGVYLHYHNFISVLENYFLHFI